MPSRVPRTIAVSVFLLALGAASAGAVDGSGGYFVRGIGNELCASYAVARESHRDSEYEEWLAGYESAFNRWTSGVWNIETGDNFANSLQWIDYYCSIHPSATFGTAAQNLIAFLYPSREREDAATSLPQGGAGASAPTR